MWGGGVACSSSMGLWPGGRGGTPMVQAIALCVVAVGVVCSWGGGGFPHPSP